MANWLSMLQGSSAEYQSLATRAAEIKAGSEVTKLRGKNVGFFFFNPSLRTRMSFEVALNRYGGRAVVLQPGNDTWNFEHRSGVVMNEKAAEHIKEAVQVAGRYCDALGVRSFAKLESLSADLAEPMLAAFERYSTVPVINLESAVEHPCQAAADMLTLREKLGSPKAKRFVLSWAPHINPLPMAVPHSALLAAAHSGMHITVACPPQYRLSDLYWEQVTELCKAAGTSCQYQTDQQAAVAQADVVYVKSWGAPCWYGDKEAQRRDFEARSDWTVTLAKLPAKSILMHCLPVRRNVVIADDALDSKHSVVIDQAENRLWAQVAILEQVLC